MPTLMPPRVAYLNPKSFKWSRNSVVLLRPTSVKHSKTRSANSRLPKAWFRNPISSGMIELKTTRPTVVAIHLPGPRLSSTTSLA